GAASGREGSGVVGTSNGVICAVRAGCVCGVAESNILIFDSARGAASGRPSADTSRVGSPVRTGNAGRAMGVDSSEILSFDSASGAASGLFGEAAVGSSLATEACDGRATAVTGSSTFILDSTRGAANGAVGPEGTSS